MVAIYLIKQFIVISLAVSRNLIIANLVVALLVTHQASLMKVCDESY